MSLPLVLTPVFVLVALAFLLMLGANASAGSRAGSGTPAVVSPGGCAAALQEQYGLPMLFHVLTVLSLATRHADLIFVLLAFVFAALRVLHAVALATDRGDTTPAMLHVASALVLAVAWGVFAVRILSGF